MWNMIADCLNMIGGYSNEQCTLFAIFQAVLPKLSAML